MKKNYKILLSIVALVLIAVSSYFLFARDTMYKYQDFKKLPGRVEACKLKGTKISIYKYINKEGSIFLTGENGEYTPCIVQDGAPSEQCEVMLSALADCSIVMDSNNKTYSSYVHDKVPSIVNNIAVNEAYQTKYIADVESSYITRLYASADTSIVLKNQQDIGYGKYTLTQNGKETVGEWIQDDLNKNKIFLMDNTDITITIKDNNMNFGGKVLTLKK